MIPDVPAPLTHPETAWFSVAVPLCLTVAVLLVAALFGRSTLQPAYQKLLARYNSRDQFRLVEPSLVYVPMILSPQLYFLFCSGVTIVLWCVLWLSMPMWIALLLSPLAMILVMWCVLYISERRYVMQLEQALAPTVARMAAMLSNGSGFQIVLRRVVDDLPAGPLRHEWQFIIDQLGTPLVDGGLATAQVVVDALRFQTPSRQHRLLLEHLSVALGQTHDVLVRRLQAAAQALHDASRRRSAAATELAQMKYSGVVVGLAGLVMTTYLAFTQSKYFLTAYQGPLGLLVGLIVGSALAAPLIGGLLLARSDDLDY